MRQTWSDLPVPLSEPVHAALRDLGFAQMLPVQAACVPPLLSHKDVAAEAVTGSGKTLAFLVPVIELLLRRETPLRTHDVGALILLPTRELATQVFEVLNTFLRFAPSLTGVLFVGGKSVSADVRAFASRGGHVVVSTPGRLHDLLSRRRDESVPTLAAGVRALEVLILDEADRLLEAGFSAALNAILAHLPKQRRTGIFSATQTDDVAMLVRAGLRNPIQVRVKERHAAHDLKTPAALQNFFLMAEPDAKLNVLVRLLEQRARQKTLVFFSTCACVEYFYEVLRAALQRQSIAALHGKMKSRRFRLFDEFRRRDCGVLMCTDVMCRGVDIPSVDWVIQFDPPSSAASFVHRCGRTARCGQAGSALLLLLPNEAEYVRFIELNQKVRLAPMEAPAHAQPQLELMRRLQLTDRAVMDLANRAFVSHVQAYTKHECNLLINVRSLNLGRLATGFGLLKMPRMPELRKLKRLEFEPHDVDTNSIAYADPKKEEERQKKLAAYKETGVWPGLKARKQKTESWSQAKEKKTKRKERKEKKQKTIDKNRFSEEDLKDLDEDFKMIKKFRKGKVSDDDLSQYFRCAENEDCE